MTNKLNAHASQPMPDPRDLNKDVPEGLVAIIRRMTDKRPEQRYQTPQELLKDIEKTSLRDRNVSNDVLEGLAGKQKRKLPQRTSTGSGSQRTMPPKNKKNNASDDEAGGFHVAPFKLAFMSLIAAGLLIGLFWLFNAMSTFFEPDPTGVQRGTDQYEKHDPVAQPQEPLPVKEKTTKQPPSRTLERNPIGPPAGSEDAPKSDAPPKESSPSGETKPKPTDTPKPIVF